MKLVVARQSHKKIFYLKSSDQLNVGNRHDIDVIIASCYLHTQSMRPISLYNTTHETMRSSTKKETIVMDSCYGGGKLIEFICKNDLNSNYFSLICAQ